VGEIDVHSIFAFLRNDALRAKLASGRCRTDQHDKHILRANKGVQMRMVCVFNPPVTGREIHDIDGAYAPPLALEFS
jgi:hypothetical protein